ncbi:MAG TPA: LytTR family transcriptional regulator DNA-binding domain-containing protein [Bacteroidia bacterium]|jgi:two-component system LytT family response regulator|nr:LytTR family transcriptional regulator DNA-binding domain-containing protein [Bacteroidia bacterium]
MIKTIIIDDEPLARDIIKEYLRAYPFINLAQECGDGFEGVKAISQHQPDLIFLDVQMPKINGFEMLELLNTPPAVIFTTAFDEFAIKAFETHAIDYLLKPFSRERFDKAVQKWKQHHSTTLPNPGLSELNDETFTITPEQHTRVVVKTGNNIRIIPMHEILYLQADDDYVKIHTKDGSFLKKKTISYFEKVMDTAQFVRVHRSYIVQVQQVTRIEPYEKEGHLAILKSGEKIPISKTGYPKLKSILGL